MNATIMVPTMNRSDFIIRLLDYYAENGFPGRILIGDGSGPDHVEKTRTAIERLAGRLNVQYHVWPGLNSNDTMKNLNDLLETDYVAYLGDDDLIVPEGLARCVEFLENTPGYSAANGEARGFRLNVSGAYGRMEITGEYPQPFIEKKTGAQRLLYYLANYSVSIFSVHRVDVWRLMWKDLGEVRDQTFGGEILPCCMSVVQGKIKHLDSLYLLRQCHDQLSVLPSPPQWVTHPDFYESYMIFETSLAQELSRIDGISLDEAREIVRIAFASYLFPIRHSRLVTHWLRMKNKYEDFDEADTTLGYRYYKFLCRIKEPGKRFREGVIALMAYVRSSWVVGWDHFTNRRKGMISISRATKAPSRRR